MADTQTLSEAARRLAACRWGAQVPVRAAEVVIQRAAELPPDVRAAVHEVTGPEGGQSRPGGDQE